MRSVMFAMLVLAARSAAAEDLYVDGGQPACGNRYQTISAAVGRARQDRLAQAIPPSETIVISVAPGTYFGSYVKTGPKIEPLPIILDVPNLELRGATTLTPGADGMPTGQTSNDTRVAATPYLGGAFPPDHFVFLIGPTGPVLTGSDVTVSRFVIDGGTTGTPENGAGIGVDRAPRALIRDNVIRRTVFGLFTRASNASFQGNLLTHNLAGAILGAGSPAAPASYLFSHNRVTQNSGIGVSPQATAVVYAFDPALTPIAAGTIYDRTVATISDNDLSDTNQIKNFSSGLRCMMFVPVMPAEQQSGDLTVVASHNRIANNSIGIQVEAGFPFRANPLPLTATFHGVFTGNEVVGSDALPALVTFTNNSTALNPSELSDIKYIEGSTYELTVSDGELDGASWDAPLTDPYSGNVLCNRLVVNGVALSPGCTP